MSQRPSPCPGRLRNRIAWLPGLVLLSLVAPAGCQSMIDATRTTTRQVVKQFTPSPHDYRSSTEDPIDQLDEFTRQARETHVLEKDPDPFYRRWLMSAKARQTERHLGFE